MQGKNFYKYMFLSAALVNCLAGLLFVFAPYSIFSLLGLAPYPETLIYSQLFGVLVLAFGWGYFEISRDMLLNIPIVKLGIVGKLLVFATALWAFTMASISWQFMLLVCVDIIYPFFFYSFLKFSAENRITL